jgi:glycosyltransferase involved in cell wall biosynthesis
MSTISIIMPVYKGESTVQKTLESLLSQIKNFDELIIINDASPDNSKSIIENYLKGKIEYKVINHEKNLGLAKSYNDGILKSIGSLVVTLHQDVILEKDALEKLVEPFSDTKVVTTGHVSTFPYAQWKKYSFWKKCFFARFVGKEFSGINGQFDCFRKDALEKVGLFDGKTFRSAGEDADILYKLKKIGKIAYPKAKIIHLQSLDQNFSYKDIIFKQKQHSEARGTLLRLGRIGGFANICKIFFREIMIISLLVPFLNIVSLVLIVGYSFIYTWPVYLEEYKNPRILLLPFFNIYLLFVGFYYSLRGFIYGKQRI